MAALRNEQVCFAHSPAAAAARSAARRRGGTNKRAASPSSEAPPPVSTPDSATVPGPETFELGELTDARDIGPALLRLAHAIARGLVDPRRGRLLTEALRASSFAFAESGGVGEKAKRGWDLLDDDELERFRRTGKLPEGVTAEDLEKLN